MTLIYQGKEWTTEKLEEVYGECERIGAEELKLDWYPNQFEIVSYAEMLDVHSSHGGMPVMYHHWSFGKSFLENYNQYKAGRMGLSLETVLNSNPCINYLMDENTMTGQALVIAHAAIGHNSFFKNNYMFKQWTAADYIVDYLDFAKKYIAKCEEQYGYEAVELILDAAHSMMNFGVDKYIKPKILSQKEEKDRQKQREEDYIRNYDELWSIVPQMKKKRKTEFKDPFLPRGYEENLLYFLEKKAPLLETWQREILRIVRKISQYFYPQMQTKMINEGWASTVHYYIMNRLYEKGQIDDGSMLEFLDLHTSVVRQVDYDHRGFYGFNPYHMGFSIFQDIKRMSENPTAEDREFHPDVAGGDWVENWKYAYENFRDDSFAQQYLSQKVARDMRLFSYQDDAEEDDMVILNIHNERGFKKVRKALSDQYNLGNRLPDIQVTGVDFESRTCILTHFTQNEVLLKEDEALQTLDNFQLLWGFDVMLQTRDRNTNTLIAEYPTDFAA